MAIFSPPIYTGGGVGHGPGSATGIPLSKMKSRFSSAIDITQERYPEMVGGVTEGIPIFPETLLGEKVPFSALNNS